MINKIIFQGRLTADPVLKKTTSEISVCSFTVAWSEKRNEIEAKCFLRCTAWRGTAEFISKYFKKGQEILVSGKLTTSNWTDNEGNSKTSLEMTVEEAHFCGSKAANDQRADTGALEEITPSDENDGLPF
jgi:single-strand DNA-binding protein